MKHLLNDLTNDEKNRIREQYNGGMSIDTSKFRRLMESKLGDVKPLLEQAVIKKPTEDPYAYKQDGDKYYIINLGSKGDVSVSQDDPRWKEVTNPTQIDAIQTQIFSDNSSTESPATETTLAQQVLKITKDSKWQKFPCVPLTPKVKGIAATNGSDVSFALNGKQYFNNGIFMTSDFKGQGTFSCSSDNKIVEKKFESNSNSDKVQKTIDTLSYLYPGLSIFRSESKLATKPTPEEAQRNAAIAYTAGTV